MKRERKPCPLCGAAWARDIIHYAYHEYGSARGASVNREWTRWAVFACGTRTRKAVRERQGRQCLERELAQLKAVNALLKNSRN